MRITTLEELDALPVGQTIMVDIGYLHPVAFTRHEVGWFSASDWESAWPAAEVPLPATAFPSRDEIVRALYAADVRTGWACEDFEDMNAAAVANYEAGADAVLALFS